MDGASHDFFPGAALAGEEYRRRRDRDLSRVCDGGRELRGSADDRVEGAAVLEDGVGLRRVLLGMLRARLDSAEDVPPRTGRCHSAEARPVQRRAVVERVTRPLRHHALPPLAWIACQPRLFALSKSPDVVDATSFRSRNRATDAHTRPPQAGHASLPISKQVSQSMHNAILASGTWAGETGALSCIAFMVVRRTARVRRYSRDVR
jgi:hypothetical protein